MDLDNFSLDLSNYEISNNLLEDEIRGELSYIENKNYRRTLLLLVMNRPYRTDIDWNNRKFGLSIYDYYFDLDKNKMCVVYTLRHEKYDLFEIARSDMNRIELKAIQNKILNNLFTKYERLVENKFLDDKLDYVQKY